MPNKYSIKGKIFERATVTYLQPVINIERTWGSNGKSQGLPEEVDIIITKIKQYTGKDCTGDAYTYPMAFKFTGQCKSYRNTTIPPGFKTMCKKLLTNVDFGILKETTPGKKIPIGEALCVIPLKILKQLLE